MHFLYFNVFYMMLIPLVLLIFLVLTSKDNMQRYFSPQVIDKLKVGTNYLDKNSRNILFFTALVFFVIALARPVLDKKEQKIEQSIIPIVIALDMSKSMWATDIYPNRINLAKQKLKQLINNAKNAHIGVVLFAYDTFVLSPVTSDFVSLNYLVDNIDTSIQFSNGSNILSVIDGTNLMLKDFDKKNLIILSDGGNKKDYTKELELAKQNNITIYSIGIATQKGSPIPQPNGYLTDQSGNIVTTKLNEAIKDLAVQSGGGYIDFSLDNSDVKAIINKIEIEAQKQKIKSAKYKIYTELFYYPLGFGILMLLFALSSFPDIKLIKKASIFLFVILLPYNSKAFELNFQNINKATKAYKQQNYKEAKKYFQKVTPNNQQRYNLANTLYKLKKYKEAIKEYSKIVTKDQNFEANKLYNIANSYVKLNNLQMAKEFYEKSLKIRYDKDTKENLDAVNKELQKQKKQQQKNQNNKNDKNNQNIKKQNKNNKKQQNQNNKNQKNQQQKQNKKNQDNKKQNQQNNKNNKQDNQKQQNKNKQNQDKQNQSKKEQTKKKKQELSTNKERINKNFIQNKKDKYISTQEEKKWLQLLQNKKTPIFLRKITNKHKGDNSEYQPW